jgi:TonB-dependent SusC/RagA subfamily outer membrane receptor
MIMQKLQLSIPEPCHENWQQMTPTDQGRFCNACAKEVIDFSTMTDMQVLNYFSNLTHEKVCGRALPEQLNRPISRPAEPKKRLFWYWNYFVMFFMFFAKGNSARAQGGIKPVTELSPVKIRGGMVAMSPVKQQESRLITGKVTNKDGNPVSFATIKIKGSSIGRTADANGNYSIKVHPGEILNISASGYKETEVAVGTLSSINTQLELYPWLREVVIIAGGMGFRNMDNEAEANITKHLAVIKVKEERTGLSLDQVKITIINDDDGKKDSAFTNRNGIYKYKNLKENNSYSVKIEADGYELNEFTIEGHDIEDRKIEWEVLLRKKQQKQIVNIRAGIQGLNITSAKMQASNADTHIRMGSVTSNIRPLLVVDDEIMSLSYLESIKPGDIENVKILKGAEATALYGSAALDGVIILTIKKLKVKSLETVTVTSSDSVLARRLVSTTTCTKTVMGATIKEDSAISNVANNLKSLVNIITGAIKIYPNPVQRGQQFNIVLKLKQTGVYHMQITNSLGIIFLQKQINMNAMAFTENMLADSRWSAGLYYIRVFDSNNKLISKNGFIVQ